jgi:hypothetical protein
MKLIFRWNFVSQMIFITAFLFPAAGIGQSLPEGRGRDVLLTACTVCHGMDNIIQPHKKFSAEEWEFYLYDMVARGAPMDEGDIETVKQYLIDNFAVR